MLEIRRSSGNVAGLIADLRDIPTRVIPYAASTALTASAREAQSRVQQAMPRVFDRPTPYTLNSLRFVPSTAQTLVARVAVKDQVGSSGIPPEKFLEPEVEGGSRGEKRYEKALRFAGVLRSGESTVPGSDAPLDAFGNLSSGTIRGILSQLGSLVKNGQAVKGKRLKRGVSGTRPEYFAGAAGHKQTRGIWLREKGQPLKAIMIFVKRPPSYRSRLDFTGIAEAAVRDVFPTEFEKVAATLTARFGP